MQGVRWYSLKHNAWANVTDEPKTANGYYTIEFDNGMFRRYNAARIKRELANQPKSFDIGDFSQWANAQSGTATARQSVSSGIATPKLDAAAPHTQGEAPLYNCLSLGDTATATQRAPRKGVLIGLVFEKR